MPETVRVADLTDSDLDRGIKIVLDPFSDTLTGLLHDFYYDEIEEVVEIRLHSGRGIRVRVYDLPFDTMVTLYDK